MSSPTIEDVWKEMRALGFATRLGFLAICLLSSYFAFRLAFSVESLGIIYADMLGGKGLPEITNVALAGRMIWMFLSIICPVAAIVLACAVKSSSKAVVGIIALTSVLFIQSIFLWSALSEPFYLIIRGMQAN